MTDFTETNDITEIERIQTQIRAMGCDNTLIHIDGSGIEPYLEYFMFEILETIKLKGKLDD